mmetsp:Transcript_7656/g.18755  ORF Transcript_7656/g.18755 Transcript_7656/m.18755 type:complete len:203 (-) Transcript_7656:172-780(-)
MGWMCVCMCGRDRQSMSVGSVVSQSLVSSLLAFLLASPFLLRAVVLLLNVDPVVTRIPNEYLLGWVDVLQGLYEQARATLFVVEHFEELGVVARRRHAALRGLLGLAAVVGERAAPNEGLRLLLTIDVEEGFFDVGDVRGLPLPAKAHGLVAVDDVPHELGDDRILGKETVSIEPQAGMSAECGALRVHAIAQRSQFLFDFF